jgi:hypothetical protein
MECVREIRDEQLHLMHRHFGVQVNDGGQQNGSALVGFAKCTEHQSHPHRRDGSKQS